jgi:hypothetical protein
MKSNLKLRVNDVDIDLSEIDIVFKKNILNYTDPSVRQKDFTYKFDVPKNKETNRAFKNASGKSIGKFNTPVFPAKLFNSFDVVFSGVAELHAENNTSYTISIRTNLKEIKDLLEGKTLKDLQFEDVPFDVIDASSSGITPEDLIADHINRVNIISPHIEFPYIMMGRTYTPQKVFNGFLSLFTRFVKSSQRGASEAAAVPIRQLFESEVAKRFFYFKEIGGNVNQLYYEQFPPATYLTSIIRQMFLDAGYQVGGSFFRDETIRSIVIPYLESIDNWKLAYDSGIVPDIDPGLVTYRMRVDSIITNRQYSSTTFEDVIYDDVVEDIQNQINPTTWVFTAGTTFAGTLRVWHRYIGNTTNTPPNVFTGDWRVVSSINGVIAEGNLDTIPIVRNVKLLDVTMDYEYTSGETIVVQVRHNAAIRVQSTSLWVVPISEPTASFMRLRNWQMPIDQLTFLKNIINYFNLYFDIDLDEGTFLLDLPQDFFTKTALIDLTDTTRKEINFEALSVEERDISLEFTPTDQDVPYSVFTTFLRTIPLTAPNTFFRNLNLTISDSVSERDFNRVNDGIKLTSIFSPVNMEQLYVLSNDNTLIPTKVPKFINTENLNNEWNKGQYVITPEDITDGQVPAGTTAGTYDVLWSPDDMKYPNKVVMLKYLGQLPDTNAPKIWIGDNNVSIPLSDWSGNYIGPDRLPFFGNGSGNLMSWVLGNSYRPDPQAFFANVRNIQLSFNGFQNNVYEVCWTITHSELDNAYIAQFVVETGTDLYNRLRPNTDILIDGTIYNIVEVIFEPLPQLSRIKLKTNVQ